MSRQPRNFIQTSFFHIITQGINKSYIFDEAQDIKYYIKIMYDLLTEHKINIIAYCIMNNHTHILIESNNQFPIALSYVLFVIAAGLLASLIFTPLKKWMYLEKEEKDGTVRYYRKRISILPIMEWIFLLSNVLLIILLTIF